MGEEEVTESEELQDIAVQLVETGIKLAEKLLKTIFGSVGGLVPSGEAKKEE